MAKSVIKKIKIVKNKDISKNVINQVSDMMKTCSISETNQKQIDILQNKVNELESEIMIKREQLRNVMLFLNGEGDCICMNKTSKVGKVKDVDESLLHEEPLPDEDGEYQNYFQNVMCVPCLVDYYYKRLNKLNQSVKKSYK